MGPSDRVSTEFAPTGIVEIERNGMVHRGTYRTAAAIVAVNYGGQVRQMQMRRHTDTPLGIAQMLLRELVAKIHESVQVGAMSEDFPRLRLKADVLPEGGPVSESDLDNGEASDRTHSPFRVIDGGAAASAAIIAMAMDEVVWQLVQLLIDKGIIAREELADRIDRVAYGLSNSRRPTPDCTALAAALKRVVTALA
jgi:hypothetical protein